MPSMGAMIRLPLWLSVIVNLQLSLFLYMYTVGVVIQDMDVGYTWTTILSHIPITIVLTPVATVLEMLAIFYAIFFKTTRFEVVAK